MVDLFDEFEDDEPSSGWGSWCADAVTGLFVGRVFEDWHLCV